MPCHVPICNALVFFILKAAYFFSHEHPVNSQVSFWGGLVCISLKQLLPHFFVSLVLMWMCRHFMSFEKTQINIFQHSVIIGGSSIICDTQFQLHTVLLLTCCCQSQLSSCWDWCVWCILFCKSGIFCHHVLLSTHLYN